MSDELIKVIAKTFTALSGDTLTYNSKTGTFLTNGYTSAAGNTYFRALRFSERLAISFDIGVGYYHTFLNGVTIYACDGQRRILIAQKFYSCRFFNEQSAKEECIMILKDYLAGQAKMIGSSISESELLEFSTAVVNSTYQKRIA